MPRIISGTHKGRRLHSVPGQSTRPTSDRVKESVFSRLEGYDAILEAVVVDLFAGSGALGLEAISRGARSLELVDRAEPALRTLRRNAAAFGEQPGATAQITVHRAEALRYLRTRTGEPIELLLLDPPYTQSQQDLHAVLQAAVGQLHEAAAVVVEREAHSGEPLWPEGLELFSERTYGSTQIWLAEPALRR